MKARSGIILLFLTITVAFLSCEKDTETEETKLYLSDITNPDGVRVFTRNGEITDPLVIERAKIATPIPEAPVYNAGLHGEYNVGFLPENKFRIGNDYFIYSKAGNQYIFQRPDSSISPTHELETMVHPFLKFPKIRSNNNGLSVLRDQFAGYGSESEIKVVALYLAFLKRDPSSGAITLRYLDSRNNEFNVNGINSLGIQDTLAIREVNHIYKLR